MKSAFIDYKKAPVDTYIIFLYFFISLVVTLPLIFDFSHSVVSDSLVKEVLFYPKYNWWLKKALFELHINPFYCTWNTHPTGINYSLDLLHLSIYWLFLPFSYFFSLAAVHNLIIVSCLAVSAYGAYLLVKYLTQDRLVSFLSGIIFGFSPYLLAVALNGWIHAIAAQWIPLYILNLIKAFDQQRKRNAIFAALFLALSFYCSFYYFIYLIIFTAIFLLYQLWFDRQKLINIQFIKNLLLLLGVFILAVLPVSALIYSFRSSVSHFQWSIHAIDVFLSADLAAFFSPLFKRGVTSFVNRTTYLGYLVLILSLLGISFRKKQAYLWLWTALVFFVLVLGPYLKINDTFIFYGFKIPLLSLALDKLLPFWAWGILRVHLRATCLVMLSLAILSAYGLQRLFRNLSQLKKKAVTCFLSVFILFEFLIISPIPYPMPLLDITDVPSFYHELAREEGDFAILDWPPPNWWLPISIGLLLRLYPYYQTVHNKNILVSHSAKRGFEMEKNYFLDYHPFPALISLLTKTSPVLNFTSSDFSLLRLFDIKYILVHNSLLRQGYGQAAVEVTNSVLEQALGKPECYPEDELCVYRLYDKQNPKTEQDLVMKYTILGDLYLEDREYNRARQAYQQALGINPNLEDIQVKLRKLR